MEIKFYCFALIFIHLFRFWLNGNSMKTFWWCKTLIQLFSHPHTQPRSLSHSRGWLDCCFNQPKEHFAVSSEKSRLHSPGLGTSHFDIAFAPHRTSPGIQLHKNVGTQTLAESSTTRERARHAGKCAFSVRLWITIRFRLDCDWFRKGVRNAARRFVIVVPGDCKRWKFHNFRFIQPCCGLTEEALWGVELFRETEQPSDWVVCKSNNVAVRFFGAHCIIKLNSCQRLDNLPFRLENNCSDRPTKKKERILLF